MELAHLPTNIALKLPGRGRKLNRTQQCCLLSLVKARATIISQLSPKDPANWAEGKCEALSLSSSALPPKKRFPGQPGLHDENLSQQANKQTNKKTPKPVRTE
jgi:hypothetical protein